MTFVSDYIFIYRNIAQETGNVLHIRVKAFHM